MHGETGGSRIVVGWQEEQRFIAVQPELSDQEKYDLRQRNLIRGSVQDVDSDPRYTRLNFPASQEARDQAGRQAQRVALGIAAALFVTRRQDIKVELVDLADPENSPFDQAVQEVNLEPIS